MGQHQYDLPNGLLIAWLRTGDPSLWRYAQASVRHLMDLDLVKFYPFLDKLNGLVYRKGEMRRQRSHIDAEPITDQGFAFRSLLLYWQLTGETWARDLAKQNIDRLVFYAVTRPQFVLHGGRPTAWMLRAALAGAEWFPKDRNNQYQLVADSIVRQLLDYYRDHKRLPGTQPVWQAQMIEGLAEYQRRTESRRRRRAHRRTGTPLADGRGAPPPRRRLRLHVLLRRLVRLPAMDQRGQLRVPLALVGGRRVSVVA